MPVISSIPELIIPTVELSVSSKKLSNCQGVVETMRHLGIMSSITPNHSVVCNESNCWVEVGCRLIIPNITKHKLATYIWPSLQQRHQFQCAHINVTGLYSGCIINYLQPSKCPGNGA